MHFGGCGQNGSRIEQKFCRQMAIFLLPTLLTGEDAVGDCFAAGQAVALKILLARGGTYFCATARCADTPGMSKCACSAHLLE